MVRSAKGGHLYFKKGKKWKCSPAAQSVNHVRIGSYKTCVAVGLEGDVTFLNVCLKLGFGNFHQSVSISSIHIKDPYTFMQSLIYIKIFRGGSFLGSAPAEMKLDSMRKGPSLLWHHVSGISFPWNLAFFYCCWLAKLECNLKWSFIDKL